MASVFESLLSSRRIRSKSRSEVGKQLHARFGDSSITAPQNGGWSQQYLEDDLHNVQYQAHGSPDSQKTLINDSPELGYDPYREKIENILQAIKAQKFSNTPIIKEVNGQITITISTASWPGAVQQQSFPEDLRRPSPAQSTFSNHHSKPADNVITAESRPSFPPISTFIDDVITVESRDTYNPNRIASPILQAQSPVYDDVSTFYTRAARQERNFGPSRLPQIQTSVPMNRSQPASALSILSPVQETYNGRTESNNATPLDATPIAQHIAASLPSRNSLAADLSDVESLTQRLEKFRNPCSPPISAIASPIEPYESDAEKQWTAMTVPARPGSRGPGIGEVAFMRASSRGPDDRRNDVRGEHGRRSASRDPYRRDRTVEPAGRSRSIDRDGLRARAESREPATRRGQSRGRSIDPVGSSRTRSQDPQSRRSDSVERPTRRVEFVEPGDEEHRRARDATPLAIPRVMSPEMGNRRAFSRDRFERRRQSSPESSSRRAASREPTRSKRVSMDFSRRAASVGPLARRGSPNSEGGLPRGPTPPSTRRGRQSSADHSGSESSGADDDDFDRHDRQTSPSLADDAGYNTEATDIETETDEAYYDSRKEWNGRANNGAQGKGFYGDVETDYKLIAKDVEAAQNSGAEREVAGINIAGLKVNITKVKAERVEKTKDRDNKDKKDIIKKYATTDMVPANEDLWG